MPKSDKAKTAGKFVVIMLCFAILFFLLLPFLENPSGAQGEKGKKAVPQIFTSNPLSELVRKVYSMFARNQKRANATGAQQYALAQEGILYDAQAETQRYAAQNDGSSRSSASGGNYGYGDAGIVNEDGEWVLVRQTVPEAAQRGMHEVNSSDTAYEKLMRLERSAKYTGHPAQPAQQYPDSKWARLWNPVKNFFGFGQEGQTISSSDEEQAFALASASDGLGRDRAKNGGAYGRPGQGLGFGGTALRGANAQADNDPGLFALLNPQYAIDAVADNLIAQAEKELSGDQLNDFKEKINKQKEIKYEQIRQAFLNKLAQDAQGQEPEDLLKKTYLCGDPSGMYKSAESSCDIPVSAEQRSQSIAAAVQKQKESLNELERLAGKELSEKDLNMIVILGTTTDANPMAGLDEEPHNGMSEEDFQALPEDYKKELEEKDQLRKTLKEFYQFMMEKQGCGGKEECFWVGGDIQPDPSMRNTVIGSGMNYNGDPLNLGQNFVAQFVGEKQAQGEPGYEMIPTQLAKYPPYYYPLNKQNMAALNQRNFFDPANPKKPEKPTVALFPTAANAKEVIDKGGWQYAGLSIYGGDILNKDAQMPVDQRSDVLRNKLVERAQTAIELARNGRQDLARFGTTVLMQSAAPQIQEDIEKQVQEGKIKDILNDF